jgi:septum formation protein
MLLRQIGLSFEVLPTDAEETSGADALADPADQALRIAELKARAAAGKLERAGRAGALVLGADTVVLIDGHTLGKPAGRDEAARMLRLLSGRVHTVLTGVALFDTASGRILREIERTRVKMRRMAPAEIELYVNTGEPMDKAGAYAVQGLGSAFIERVEGCYPNVVGLPLVRVGRMLESMGYRVVDAWQTAVIGCAGGTGDDHDPEDQGPTG